MARGLEPAGVEFIAENIDSYIRDLGKADKAQQGLGDSSEGASSKLNILGSVITGVSTAFVTFALDAAVAASKALVGIAVDSIQVAIDFDSSMATLSIAASATGLSFDELSETALAVGGDTSLLGVSASGAAESMEGLFKAGLTTEEVFGDLQGYLAGTAELGGTLRASIDLAAATTLDMVAASDVASIALATFGNEAKEAGISTDEWINAAMNNLVQAADASVAEVDGLVEALKMVGPAASAMGVTLAETNNALALLSTRGIQGSSAGTALNRMMADLVKGTPKATEMMESLGISVYDSSGAFLPLVEIIGQFEIALGDATDAERDAAMASIFTAQGARAMNTLLEEGVQGWVDMTEATADAATMQEQAAVKAETFAAKQEALQGVIETLQIAIGTPFLDAMGGVANAFSDLAVEYTPMITEVFEKLGGFLGEVTEHIGLLVDAFIEGGFDRLFATFEDGSTYVGGFLETLGAGEETAQNVGQAINNIATGTKDLIEAITEGGIVDLFSKAFDIDPAVVEAVGLVEGAIRRIFGGDVEQGLLQIQFALQNLFGLDVANSFNSLRVFLVETLPDAIEAVKEIIFGEGGEGRGLMPFAFDAEETEKPLQGFREVLEGIMNFIRVDLPPIAETVGEVFGKIGNVIGEVAEFIGDNKEIILKVLAAVGVGLAAFSVLSTVVPAVVGFVSAASALFGSGGALAGAGAILSTIVGILGGPLTIVLGVVAALVAAFVANVGGFRDKVMPVFEAIAAVWTEEVMPALTEAWDAIKESFGIISEVLGELGIEFDDTGSGIETVVGIIVGVIEVAGVIIAGVLTAISGTVKFFAEHFKGVWEGIRDVIQGVKEWFEGFKQFWTSLFEGDLPGAFEGLKKAFAGVWKTIKGTVKLIVKAISMPFAGLYKLIEGFVKGVIKFFKNLKKKLVGGSIIPDMMDKIEKVIDTVLEAIKKIWETIFEKILDTTQKIFESIERTIDRIMSAIEKIIDTIVTAISGNWEDFVDLLHELWEDTWNDIRDAVDTIFSAIEALIDRIADSIKTAWENFVEDVQEVWETAWEAIEAFVDTTFSNIETLIDTISGNIRTAWETFTGSVQETWETVWAAIETFVDTIFSNIETLIDTISGSIQTAWETFTGSIQSTWETVWGTIETFVDTTFNNIETLIDTISGSIETAWNTFTGAIQATWETVWGAIETFVNTVFGNVETAIGTISGRIETTWDTWVGNLRSAFETMFNALEGIVNTAMGLVSDAVSSALSALANILAVGSNLYNGIMTIGHNIADAIKDGVVALWSNVTDAVKAKLEALGAVGTFTMDVWSKVSDLGKKIVNMIKSGLTSLWDATTGTVTGVVKALRDKLGELLGSVGDATWNTLKAIGVGIMNMVLQGVQSAGQFATNFWNWLWAQITNWLGGGGAGGRSAGESVGDRVGNNVMDSMVSSVYSQAGRFTDALNYVVGQASGDWTGTTMMQATAGFTAPLGMTAPAVMAPAAMTAGTEITIGPNYINDSMDVAEFETRVRQAVSEAI